MEWDPVYRRMHLNPRRTHTQYSDIKMQQIINRLLDERRRSPNPAIQKKVLFLFDDVGAEKGIKNAGRYTNIMDRLAFLARHWGFSAIWVVQDICSLSNPVRKNADGAIIFETLNYQELVTLYQTFGVGKFHTFRRFLSYATNEDFQFLFVHRQGPRCTYYKGFATKLIRPDD